MSDDSHLLADGSEDRFVRALAAEVERRMEIPPSFDKPSAFAKIQGRVGTSVRLRPQSVQQGDRPRNNGRLKAWPLQLGRQTLRNVFWSVGSLVVAALAVVLLSYKADRSAITRTYRTRAGQQATFTLGDGTRLTLAPQTTIRLAHFGVSSRTVDLDNGQAYFEVSRSEGTPFLVRSGPVVTRALGTAFLVRHYADDRRVHVAVSEGKVSVTSAVAGHRPLSSPVTLAAGYVGDVTDSTVMVNAVTDLRPETDWLRGQLVFRNTPLIDVLRTLNRWYGFQFRCSDSTIAHTSVTLALDAQSVAVALSTLEQFLSVHLTVVGDTVTLTPHASGSSKGTARTHAYDVWIPTREVGR